MAWQPGTEARRIGETNAVEYTDAPRAADILPQYRSATRTRLPLDPKTAALRDAIRARIGPHVIYARAPARYVPDDARLSMHEAGRALDIMFPTSERPHGGSNLADWMVENSEALGVQFIVWDSTAWSAARPPGSARFYPYTGENAHADHVHVETTGPQLYTTAAGTSTTRHAPAAARTETPAHSTYPGTRNEWLRTRSAALTLALQDRGLLETTANRIALDMLTVASIETGWGRSERNYNLSFVGCTGTTDPWPRAGWRGECFRLSRGWFRAYRTLADAAADLVDLYASRDYGPALARLIASSPSLDESARWYAATLGRGFSTAAPGPLERDFRSIRQTLARRAGETL
jgi:hypothetical protein